MSDLTDKIELCSLHLFASDDRAAEEVYCILDDVLKATKALEQKLADAEKQNEWIACSDRLPEQGDCVLCVVDGNFCADTNGYGTATFDEFFYYCDSEDGMYDKVTHWKPITPPQEGK